MFAGSPVLLHLRRERQYLSGFFRWIENIPTMTRASHEMEAALPEGSFHLFLISPISSPHQPSPMGCQ